MSYCIGYAGCQAERHRPGCAKFDQRTEDIAALRDACWASVGEHYYRPDLALLALDRLVANNYDKDQS